MVVGERLGPFHPGLLRHHADRDRMDNGSKFRGRHRASAAPCSGAGMRSRICLGIRRHHVWPGN